MKIFNHKGHEGTENLKVTPLCALRALCGENTRIASMTESTTGTLYCYVHPNRETSLRCNNCNRPICASCAVRTPTGYRCRECVKGQQKTFDTSEWYDYVLGLYRCSASFRGCGISGHSDRRYWFLWLVPDRGGRANCRGGDRGRCAPGDRSPPLASIVHYGCCWCCAWRTARHSVSSASA